MSPSNDTNQHAFDAYGAIARVYDRLNAEIDYSAWADFVEACFARYLKEKPELLLDLACGTGSMTLELLRRGYDMIGVDASPDMLSVAWERADEQALEGALFLLQDMRSFELYGTVGAVTCCLDSINYLLTAEDVRTTFATVHNYLDPDGLHCIFHVGGRRYMRSLPCLLLRHSHLPSFADGPAADLPRQRYS